MEDFAKKLVNAIEDLGWTPRSYSGRGMFGKRCVGFVIGAPSQSMLCVGVMLAGWAVDNLDDKNEIDDFLYELCEDNAAWDNMGRDTIVYFPHVEWSDDFASNDEDENSDEDDE